MFPEGLLLQLCVIFQPRSGHAKAAWMLPEIRGGAANLVSLR
jgi:hypothetical protein